MNMAKISITPGGQDFIKKRVPIDLNIQFSTQLRDLQCVMGHEGGRA